MTTYQKHKNKFEMVTERPAENEFKLKIFKHKEVEIPEKVVKIIDNHVGKSLICVPIESETYNTRWFTGNIDMGFFDVCLSKRYIRASRICEVYITGIIYHYYTDRQNKNYQKCFLYPPVKRLSAHYDQNKDIITVEERNNYNKNMRLLHEVSIFQYLY